MPMEDESLCKIMSCFGLRNIEFRPIVDLFHLKDLYVEGFNAQKGRKLITCSDPIRESPICICDFCDTDSF
jgi:hypothetical protein